MILPTPDDLRSWSKVDWGSLDFDTDEQLARLISRASAEVMAITGRTLDGMPTEYEPLAQQAIQLRAEQIAYQSQADYLETAADFDLISGFSAGSYSETRRDLSEMPKVLSSLPALNGLLWTLLTDGKRDDFMMWILGEMPPALRIQQVDLDDQVGTFDYFWEP